MTLHDEITNILKERFPDAEMVLRDTTGTNDHWALDIASDGFAGMNKVKRHQAVYKPLRALIDSGRVHALNISAQTFDEKKA